MVEAFHFEFMRNALYAGLLTSIACGIIGTLVVVNRIVFISGGIAHSAYGGIGLALYLGFSPVLGTAGFGLGIAGIIAMVTVRNRQHSDVVIGVLWAVGMAFGIIMTDLTPGYNVDLMSYLFGSILTVPRSDLIIMVALDLVILAIVIFFYKDFLAISFDEEFAAAMGVPVTGLYLTLLAMIALSVVMIIRVVGLILVIALLSIPPYLAEKYSDKLSTTMVASILLNVLFTLIGLWLSYVFNLTSGATIIMVAGVFFFVSLIFRR
jgi:zinc transport system permease protein